MFGDTSGLMAVLALAAQPAALPIGQTDHAPPVMMTDSVATGLLTWTPGTPECGAAVTPVRLLRPYNSLAPIGGEQSPVTLRFAIDDDGRTMSISGEGSGARSNGRDEIAAALAASTFRSGAARTACTLTYYPSINRHADVPLAEIASYALNPVSGYVPKAMRDRLEASGTCFSGERPRPVLQAYPRLGDLRLTPGVGEWQLVGYDLDTEGKPVNLSRLTGSGHVALGEAAIDAMARSRFENGSRTGCHFVYKLPAATLAAPDLDPGLPDETGGASCGKDGSWDRPPRLVYPSAYLKRAIEGWAVLRYDVATWGEIGNVQVLGAQPTADFGEQAKRMLSTAKVKPSDSGAIGCIQRVRYKIKVPHPVAPAEEVEVF